MLIKWSFVARKDMRDILAYFTSLDDEETGKDSISVILHSVGRISSYPFSGRGGRIVGTRELVLRKVPYVLIYRVSPDLIEVVRVFHTSRLFPESLLEE